MAAEAGWLSYAHRHTNTVLCPTHVHRHIHIYT